MSHASPAPVLTAGVAPIVDRVQRHRDQRGRCRERCCRAHVEIDARDNGDRRISVERPHVRRDERASLVGMPSG